MPSQDPSDFEPAVAPSLITAREPARPAAPNLLGHLLPVSPSVSASSVVAIARVLRPHGVLGEFKVQILCAGPEHFLECVDTGEVFLQREGLPGAFQASVESVRLIPEGALVSLEGVETRETVEALRGAILGLREDRLPPCEPDTYYHHQLEGLRVVAAGDHSEIGTVVRVEDSPGHDQLVVRPKAGPGEGPGEKPGGGPADAPTDKVDRRDATDGGGVAAVASCGPAVLPSESTESTESAESAVSGESGESGVSREPRKRRGARKKAGARPQSRDFFIPFVGAFVARVDLAGGCIEVTLPPGFAESQR